MGFRRFHGDLGASGFFLREGSRRCKRKFREPQEFSEMGNSLGELDGILKRLNLSVSEAFMSFQMVAGDAMGLRSVKDKITAILRGFRKVSVTYALTRWSSESLYINYAIQ